MGGLQRPPLHAIYVNGLVNFGMLSIFQSNHVSE